MRLTRWTIALYMALVFVCGGVVGAFAHRLYTVSAVSANGTTRNPEEFRRRFLADMKTRLKLSDDQTAKMDGILEETRMQFRATRARIEPEMKKIREDQQQKISELLSPEQEAEWQKILAERQRNRQSKKRGGPPPATPAP
jgi:Spy/CpxP family protein refolding chaperone